MVVHIWKSLSHLVQLANAFNSRKSNYGTRAFDPTQVPSTQQQVVPGTHERVSLSIYAHWESARHLSDSGVSSFVHAISFEWATQVRHDHSPWPRQMWESVFLAGVHLEGADIFCYLSNLFIRVCYFRCARAKWWQISVTKVRKLGALVFIDWFFEFVFEKELKYENFTLHYTFKK